MSKGYSSRLVCARLLPNISCYIPRLYAENKVPLSFLHHFLHMYFGDFAENAWFRSSGNI